MRPRPRHASTPISTPAAGVALLLALSVGVLWLAAVLELAAWWLVAVVSVCLGIAAWLGFRASERASQKVARLTGALDAVTETLPPAGGAHGAAAPPSDATTLAARVEAQLATLREDSRALRALLDAADEPVLACDAANQIVAANRSAIALLASGSVRPIVGEPLDQVLTDTRSLRAVASAQRGEPARAQARLLTIDGPRIVEIAAEPVREGPFATDSPPTVAITLRDVTEQTIALQLKTDFVANASHELRTPLASIRTAAETLLDLGDEDPAIRTRLVNMIASNAERLEELSRDLLDLSRLETPDAECEIGPVDLHDIAASQRELFSGACEKRRIELVFEIDPAINTVLTDEKLVRLILRNLIDNAIKFADEGTTVRVVVDAVAASPDVVSPLAGVPVAGVPVVESPEAGHSSRATLRLRVIDKGVGIPLPQQQRVFERFFQVDQARTGSPQRRGTGLGLAIVKHAVRALEGTVRVESVWQQGTTMTVEWPGGVE